MTRIRQEHTVEPTEEDELFISFANTARHTRGRVEDVVPDAESLLDWLREHGLISARGRATEAARLRRDPDETEWRLERFRHLRDVLHATAHDISDAGQVSSERVTELNHILRHGLHYHQLKGEPGGTRYEITQVGDRLDQARAAIASSFAHFLADGAADRLRVCANDGCRWLFVDHSPTGRRRWCDMRTCGNQAKVARHRARAREQSAGVSPSSGAV
ncbi:MAG TPA: CGNR zinc finger domain-containing protein [Candidatus Limnocylindria bacterium]|nr:CGNR zinc finger domain-containing protein [Candidatus Limnocylindria bacterium]